MLELGWCRCSVIATGFVELGDGDCSNYATNIIIELNANICSNTVNANNCSNTVDADFGINFASGIIDFGLDPGVTVVDFAAAIAVASAWSVNGTIQLGSGRCIFG